MFYFIKTKSWDFQIHEKRLTFLLRKLNLKITMIPLTTVRMTGIQKTQAKLHKCKKFNKLTRENSMEGQAIN